MMIKTDVSYANQKLKVRVGKTLVYVSNAEEKAQTKFKNVRLS